eukprot:4059847-Amphidinium_carterae.2
MMLRVLSFGLGQRGRPPYRQQSLSGVPKTPNIECLDNWQWSSCRSDAPGGEELLMCALLHSGPLEQNEYQHICQPSSSS